MDEERIYICHQAFNIAYEEIRDNDEPVTASKYHHAPDRLEKLSSYVGYGRWFNELYDVGQKLISLLENINVNINNRKPKWYNGKKQINNIFDDLLEFDNDIRDFKADVSEFQLCILATMVSNSHDYAEALYDQTRYLDIIQAKIMTTGKRKISEINNTRIQLLGLMLSITAIGVSVFSIYLSLNK